MAIVERSEGGGIARLTMAAPERLNALSDQMIATLHGMLDTLAEDRTVKVVVLAGTGRAFCAGHDLKEMQAGRQAEDRGAAYFADLFDRCTALMARIRTLPQPVVAEVHGIAAAAGCQLVATCDLAVAAESAKFGVNGVNIGLFCSTPMVALSRAVPRKAAFEMLATGRMIGAEEALRLGLVNRVAPDADLGAATEELTTTIAAKLGAAVRIGKQLYHRQADLPEPEAYALAGAAMVENMLLRDTDEGISAFLGKRPPDWQG